MIAFARRIFAAMAAWPTIVRWGLVLLHIGIIWWLSSRVLGGGSAPWWVGFTYNSGHVVLFGGLAWLVAAALRVRPSPRGHHLLRAWLAVSVAALYGVVDEWHQSSVPGRSASIFDIATDSASAILLVQIAVGMPLPHRVSSIVAIAIATAASVLAATFD
ncbi:MAG: VanZ family protein [Planctomycetota bacterium]